MPCVICPFGKCTPDCIFAEVFPAEEPFTDESVLNAQKIITRFKMDYMKKHLWSCKQSGGVKLMKECIRGWVLEYDYREIDREYAISVTHEVNRKIFKLLRKRIDKCTKHYGPPKDFSIMKDVDPALLHWYKKRHGLLEDASSHDAVDAKRLKMFHAVLD